MTMPTACPKCQARFPESLEQFGANHVCLKCGQIQRYEGAPQIVANPILIDKAHGREQDRDDSIEPQALPPLDLLLTEGWQIFRKYMSLCIATFALSLALNLLALIPQRVSEDLLKSPDLSSTEQVLLIAGETIATLCQLAFSTWLNIGYTRIVLRVVRGQTAEIGDLFRGGVYFWRALHCFLVLSLLVFAALILGMIPFEIVKMTLGVVAYLGIPVFLIPVLIVTLTYWPYLYVLIDQDLPGIDALKSSPVMTMGNRKSLFALFAICLLIDFFGLLALGIGCFIAAPYTFVVIALAYDHISGYRKIRQRSSNAKAE